MIYTVAISYYFLFVPQILRYIVEKGSIAIDGISLTVAYVDESVFKVSVIPHTAAETTLLSKKAGDIVNLEEFFSKHPIVAVAFSGGVDSAYLL